MIIWLSGAPISIMYSNSQTGIECAFRIVDDLPFISWLAPGLFQWEVPLRSGIFYPVGQFRPPCKNKAFVMWENSIVWASGFVQSRKEQTTFSHFASDRLILAFNWDLTTKDRAIVCSWLLGARYASDVPGGIIHCPGKCLRLVSRFFGPCPMNLVLFLQWLQFSYFKAHTWCLQSLKTAGTVLIHRC